MVAQSSQGPGSRQMSSASPIWRDLLSMKERASRAFGRGERCLRGGQYPPGQVWSLRIAPEKFHESFCHDLNDKTESLVWALAQKPTAVRCFEEKSGAPAWKVKACWYQISANDRLIPPETEKWMAERNQREKDDYVANDSRFRGSSPQRHRATNRGSK
jgi:hypothetical protein